MLLYCLLAVREVPFEELTWPHFVTFVDRYGAEALAVRSVDARCRISRAKFQISRALQHFLGVPSCGGAFTSSNDSCPSHDAGLFLFEFGAIWRSRPCESRRHFLGDDEPDFSLVSKACERAWFRADAWIRSVLYAADAAAAARVGADETARKASRQASREAERAKEKPPDRVATPAGWPASIKDSVKAPKTGRPDVVLRHSS